MANGRLRIVGGLWLSGRTSDMSENMPDKPSASPAVGRIDRICPRKCQTRPRDQWPSGGSSGFPAAVGQNFGFVRERARQALAAIGCRPNRRICPGKCPTAFEASRSSEGHRKVVGSRRLSGFRARSGGMLPGHRLSARPDALSRESFAPSPPLPVLDGLSGFAWRAPVGCHQFSIQRQPDGGHRPHCEEASCRLRAPWAGWSYVAFGR